MRLPMSLSVFCLVLFLAVVSSVTAEEPRAADQDTLFHSPQASTPVNLSAFKPQPYSPKRDMAFVSVMGSRPKGDLKGYQKAVLYNAKGAIIQEVDISRSDSVYSLDKMINENRTRGPLFIRMIR